MNPTVAILMSVYKSDRAPVVRQAVESILSQTYADLHFYIRADGPLDPDTDRYLRALTDPRLRLTFRPDNRGLAHTLNELLQLTLPLGYDLLARMDADDISLPERIARQVAYMQAHPTTDCLGTWAIEIDQDGKEFFRKRMPETHEGCWEQFKRRDPMIHPTVMFRRRYIERAGLYAEDTYFGEDTMMWAQGFAAGCKMANIPEYLYLFRLDTDFFTRRRGWKHAKGIFTLRRRVNRMLHYPLSADLYALLYAAAKMMPTPVLNLIYRTTR